MGVKGTIKILTMVKQQGEQSNAGKGLSHHSSQGTIEREEEKVTWSDNKETSHEYQTTLGWNTDN